MTSDLERSKKYLRSILLATKGGVPEAQLVKRYREQTGENIPFRRFNCSSLQAFLQSVPDVCRVTVRGGAVVVEGVATAETKHIKEMVKMQGLHPAARTRGNGSGGKYFQSKPPPSFFTNHHLAQSSGGKSSPSQAAVQSPRGASGSPLRHVCLDQCLVGFVEARRGNEVDITLFDTTMKDVDIIINDEMIKLGFATKEITV